MLDLLSSCPHDNLLIGKDPTRCCCPSECKDQAVQIADAIYNVVRINSNRVIFGGGWLWNFTSFFGCGIGCKEWKDLVLDAGRESLTNFPYERRCFMIRWEQKLYLTFTDKIQHNFVSIRLPNGEVINIDPWESGGNSLYR